jgi:hypothetical protein
MEESHAEAKGATTLWDYGLVYETNILNRIPRGQQQRTGIELITGETPDISEWLDFEFYDQVWYYDQKKIEIDSSGRRLARWLVGWELLIESEVTFVIGCCLSPAR